MRPTLNTSPVPNTNTGRLSLKMATSSFSTDSNVERLPSTAHYRPKCACGKPGDIQDARGVVTCAWCEMEKIRGRR